MFEHLSQIATNPEVKVLTFNHEGIFNQDETDTEALRMFIQDQGNLHYPIFVDVNRVAIDGEYFAILSYIGQVDVSLTLPL